MSFGCGVGDIITVLKIVKSIRAKFKDAATGLTAINEEVESLSALLNEALLDIPDRQLTAAQQKSFQSVLVGATSVLEDLNKLLEKNGNPLHSPSSKMFDKPRKVLAKLKWDPEEVNNLRARLASSVGLLNAFIGNMSNSALLAATRGIETLVLSDKIQHHQQITDWISPDDHAIRQRDLIDKRHAGTGQWFLDSDQYHTWMKGSKTKLFCPGMPGAGKTMIAALVVNHLLELHRGSQDTIVLYLYCSYDQQTIQKLDDLLSSILKQLVLSCKMIPDAVLKLHELHRRSGTRPALAELIRTVCTVCAQFNRVFMIVDALDECESDVEQTRNRFLNEIFQLQDQGITSLSILATARFIPEIASYFEHSLSLEIRATAGDVEKVVDSEMSHLPSFVAKDPALQAKIRQEIILVADGMFLLVRLHLDSLRHKLNPKAVRHAIDNLPRGNHALDATYKQAVQRIEAQHEDFAGLAKQVFGWLTYAHRPLHTLELQHALAIEVGEQRLDEENIIDLDLILSVCAGLVTIDSESSIIRFVHYTTYEYLKEIREVWLPGAREQIMLACFTYCMFEEFASGPCLPAEDSYFTKAKVRTALRDRLNHNPFIIYAAYCLDQESWQQHSPRVTDFALAFLKEDVFLANFWQALNVEAQISSSGEVIVSSYLPTFVPKNYIKGLHYTAISGYALLLGQLLESGYRADLEDGYGRTSLMYAAENGHEDVVRLLLARPDVGADTTDEYGRTALSYAAENGSKNIVEALLARTDVNADAGRGKSRTPLLYATSRRNIEAIKLLLRRPDVEVNLCSRTYPQAPIHHGTWRGGEDVLECLLKRHDIDVNLRDADGKTPLMCAASHGSETTFRLLLNKGAHWNVHGEDGPKLTMAAARSGNIEVMNLLFDLGVSTSTHSRYWSTHLIEAMNHSGKATKLLLKRGVAVNGQDDQGETPLSHVAAIGHWPMIELLLSHGARLDFPDAIELRPLARAAQGRHLRTTLGLLERGAPLDDYAAMEIEARLRHVAEFGTTLYTQHEREDAAQIKAVMEERKSQVVSIDGGEQSSEPDHPPP